MSSLGRELSPEASTVFSAELSNRQAVDIKGCASIDDSRPAVIEESDSVGYPRNSQRKLGSAGLMMIAGGVWGRDLVVTDIGGSFF